MSWSPQKIAAARKSPLNGQAVNKRERRLLGSAPQSNPCRPAEGSSHPARWRTGRVRTRWDACGRGSPPWCCVPLLSAKQHAKGVIGTATLTLYGVRPVRTCSPTAHALAARVHAPCCGGQAARRPPERSRSDVLLCVAAVVTHTHGALGLTFDPGRFVDQPLPRVATNRLGYIARARVVGETYCASTSRLQACPFPWQRVAS
jgi:hypothetical protein